MTEASRDNTGIGEAVMFDNWLILAAMLAGYLLVAFAVLFVVTDSVKSFVHFQTNALIGLFGAALAILDIGALKTLKQLQRK